MADGRLTVRFDAQYECWIATVGGDRARAVRALMALGAAQLGLRGAAVEAVRLLGPQLDRAALLALLGVADKRQTNGRQTADDAEYDPPPTLADLGLSEMITDPLCGIGIDV